MSKATEGDDELHARALKLLTAWTHGELFRYCDQHNHAAVRHIFAIAERKYPADTDPEAKAWYEFEHMVLLASLYKVVELRAELLPAGQNPGQL